MRRGYRMANPWKAEEWNLTDQGSYIKRYGIEAGSRLARSVGSALGAPKPVVIVNHKIYVIQGKPGRDGTSTPTINVLGFTAEGPFISLERFALAPTPQGMRFPSVNFGLSAATCLFAPTDGDCTFTLTDEPDEFLAEGDNIIAQVTFPLGSQIGTFTWGSPILLPATSRLYMIAPPVSDAAFGGVQIMFRGDVT